MAGLFPTPPRLSALLAVGRHSPRHRDDSGYSGENRRPKQRREKAADQPEDCGDAKTQRVEGHDGEADDGKHTENVFHVMFHYAFPFIAKINTMFSATDRPKMMGRTMQNRITLIFT